jgi:hypothetical protein
MSFSKALVRNTGPFVLQDPTSGEVTHSARPGVITINEWWQSRLALRQWELIGAVSDTATDEEFYAYWKECADNHPLAIQSFLAAYPVEGAVVPLPKLTMKTLPVK